jgi:hypothetical protein
VRYSVGSGTRTLGPSDTLRDGITVQARGVEQATDYSSQRHFTTGAFFRTVYYILGVGATVLGSVAAGALLVPSVVPLLVGAISSIGAATFAGIMTAVNPGETAASHYLAGNEYLAIRDQARSFLNLDVRNVAVSDVTLEDRVRSLNTQRIEANRRFGGLYTPQWAYKQAKENIHRGQTGHDDELTS